jgi:hypothetical protein
MQLTTENKQKVIGAMLRNRVNFAGSDAGYATSLGINKAIYSRLKKKETDKVLSDAAWVTVARRLNVQLGTMPTIATAQTAVFSYLSVQFKICQEDSTTGIFCDLADIGKTYAAKEYVRTHKNAVYVDCSQVKSKQKLVRFIAQNFGLDSTGKYADVYADLVFYLQSVNLPTIIILDEAGDLDYPAFLELKALWNATENTCGWFMMGADGLKAKIDKGIASKKVGFTEIFSRYGAKYSDIVPKGTDARAEFINAQAAAIIALNAPTANIQSILLKANGSLRRVGKEIIKLKRSAA